MRRRDKMNELKEILKIVGATILVVVVFYVSMFFFLWLMPTNTGAVVALAVSLVLALAIIYVGYPIWFKEHIKEFDKKKNESESL